MGHIITKQKKKFQNKYMQNELERDPALLDASKSSPEQRLENRILSGLDQLARYACVHTLNIAYVNTGVHVL